MNPTGETEIEYRQIVRERALDGWRLVQVLPVEGQIFDVIFERAVRSSD